MGQLNRITQQPELMGGKACIRGMRVTVGMIVGQIGAATTLDALIDETLASQFSERQGRRIDTHNSDSMEKKKQEGYF